MSLLKRTLSLSLLTVVAMNMSCGQDNTVVTPNDGNDSSEVSVDTIEDPEYTDDLGEYDFEGYTFKFITRDNAWSYSSLLTEEENGDVLNDAIFKRQQTVSERFNVQFTETLDKTDNVSALFKESVLAGDDAYDMITTRGSDMFSFAQEGLLYPATELPCINLDKSYWSRSMTEQVNIYNNYYFAIGDISVSSYDSTHILLFSKKRMEDAGLENIYDVVNRGEWTFDKFAEYCADMTYDLNGDTKLDIEDAYGIVSSQKQVLPNFWVAAGIKTIEKDESGSIYFNLPDNTRFADIYEKIFNITYDNEARLKGTYNDDNIGGEPLANVFESDRALFMDCTFYYIGRMRASEADFGIIPYPKYDENQTEYNSRIEALELYAVPITAEDLERTSVIMEALCCESAKEVIPAYYEIALKGKAARDEESLDMLDLIADSRTIDLGDCIWWDLIRDGIFNDMYIQNNRNLSSVIAARQANVEKKLTEINETFAALDE